MGYIIGIDIGGSTTKIVGLKDGQIVSPDIVRAGDPFTSAYGAFGKYMAVNSLSLTQIDAIICTGVGSSLIKEPMFGIPTYMADEFMCVGLGGKFISSCTNAVVVSMGTGTAYVGVKDDKIWHVGGSGIGGGTLIGLSKRMIGVDTVEHIEKLCEGGDISNVDLRISDISNEKLYPGINVDLTASNFGNLSDMATKNDLALGIVNMVAETVAMISMFAAKGHGINDVVLTGNLTTLSPIREVFATLRKMFSIHFTIPQKAQFSTVIGAALYNKIR